MVEPTKAKPRDLGSLLIASESGDLAGTSEIERYLFKRGRPSTKRQMKRSKDPNSSWTWRKQRALVTADSILRRFRIMPGFWSSFSTRLLEYRATLAGSNPSNALR